MPETHRFFNGGSIVEAPEWTWNCWDIWDGRACVSQFVVSWHDVGAGVPFESVFRTLFEHLKIHRFTFSMACAMQGHCGRKFHTSFTVGNLWQGMDMGWQGHTMLAFPCDEVGMILRSYGDFFMLQHAFGVLAFASLSTCQQLLQWSIRNRSSPSCS